MKDWLGNELAVGDYIIYAAMSGRSVTMIIATIVSFNDSGTVTVRPVKSSRWKQHDHTKYVDSRTGKGINVYNDKHTARGSYLRHKDTGEELTWEQFDERLRKDHSLSRQDFDYVPRTFRDYVKVVNVVKPVTLMVTENITKWHGNPITLEDTYGSSTV